MTSKEHLMTVERTARYRTLGELTSNTRTVWFVLHGYGQLAEYFIRKFNKITDDETFIVAPEGVSRFYLDNAYDRIGASWTTRELREQEADEYLDFLNEVFDNIIQETETENIKINVMGFSQGCATALRWLNYGHVTCEKLILWAGYFAKGISDMIDPQKLAGVETYYVFGEQDEFLVGNPTVSAAFRKQMITDINPTIISYPGTHRVDENILNDLVKSWQK